MVRDTENKVKNLEEHLRILKKDVSDKNSLLSDILDSIKKKSQEELCLDEKVNDKRLALERLGEDLNSVNFKVKEALSILHDAEKRSSLLESRISGDLIRYEMLRTNVQEYEKMLDSAQLRYDESCANFNKLEESQKHTIRDLSNEIKALEVNKFSLLEDIEDVKKRMVVEETNLEKYKQKCELEMSKLDTLIQEEREKILLPMELVRSKEKALQKREKNFEIIFQRFKRVYKKLYPESDLII